MKVTTLEIPGVRLIEPRRFPDGRGYFGETWSRNRYAEAGIAIDFVQDNLSFSRRNVLRGLHFQNPAPQAKLVTVLAGIVYDVVVDLRRSSPTFRHWLGLELTGESGHQLFIPEGLAHGFVVLSDSALFFYKCSAFYSPADEHTLLWNDPALGIDWKIGNPVVSAKDQQGLPMKDLNPSWLFA